MESSAYNHEEDNVGVTLIIATEADVASIGPSKKLVEFGGWVKGEQVEGLPTWHHGNVRMWQLKNKTIFEDLLDHRWRLGTGESVHEVIFMSRHVAASTRPAFTVHPIGVPHLGPNEVAPAGGKAGRVSPPCTRVGPWFRLLKKLAEERGFAPEFEVGVSNVFQFFNVDEKGSCTDTTTRGNAGSNSPWAVLRGARYVRRDRTEEHWGREDAAELIAELFHQGLGLGGGPDVGRWSSENRGQPVLLGLGGGHYTPRHGDVAKHDGVWLGHLLSGYSLPMTDPADGTPVLAKRGEPSSLDSASASTSGASGNGAQTNGQNAAGAGGREPRPAPDMFESAVREAYEATIRAFPGGNVLAHIDLKSMKAWQRDKLTAFLAEEGIPKGTPKDFPRSRVSVSGRSEPS